MKRKEAALLVEGLLVRMRQAYRQDRPAVTAESALSRAETARTRWTRIRRSRRRLVLVLGVLVILALLFPLPRNGKVRMFGFELGRGLFAALGESSQDWSEVWERRLMPLIEKVFEVGIQKKYVNRLIAMKLPEEFAVQYRNGADVMVEETKIAGSEESWGGTLCTKEELEADRNFWLSWEQFGWKPIRGILTEVQGLPLNSPVKPVDELTPAERALLNPSFPYQNYLGGSTHGGVGVSLVETTVGILQRLRQSEVGTVEWLKSAGEDYAGDGVFAEDAFAPAEYERWFARNHLTRYASPVSRRVFEPNHPTYSPGNGYVRKITDAEAIEAINEAVEQAGMVLLQLWSGRFVPAEPGHKWDFSDVSWYYFRLYGEEEGSVIAEGLLPRWRNSWPPLPLSYQGSEPQYRTHWKERREQLKARRASYGEWVAAKSDEEVAEILLREEALAFYPVVPKYAGVETHFSDAEVERLRRGDLSARAPDTVEGLPLNDPLKPLSELTDYDRGTIVGLLSGEDCALSWFMGLGVKRIDSMEQWLRLAFTPEQLREMLLKWGTLKTPEFRSYLRAEVPPPYAAPVSADLMLPICRDFEPWGGYFAKITDEGELARVAGAAGYTPRAVYYFRLYGDERILAEGLKLVR